MLPTSLVTILQGPLWESSGHCPPTSSPSDGAFSNPAFWPGGRCRLGSSTLQFSGWGSPCPAHAGVMGHGGPHGARCREPRPPPGASTVSSGLCRGASGGQASLPCSWLCTCGAHVHPIPVAGAVDPEVPLCPCSPKWVPSAPFVNPY